MQKRGKKLRHSLLKFAGIPALISMGVLALVLLAVKLTGQTFVLEVDSVLPWHSIFEFTSSVVSISIFFIAWNAYKHTKNLRSLVLGVAFLFVGVIDFMHLLSYPGMPIFVTASSAAKSIDYWIVARLVQAIALAGFVFISEKPTTKKFFQPILLFIAISSILGVFILQSYYSHTLPVMFAPGEGLTSTKVFLEYLVIFISIIAILGIVNEFRKTKKIELMLLVSALVFYIFSELTFTLYTSAFDIFSVLGHIFKVISMIFVYSALFSNSVIWPYVKLKENQDKLDAIVNNSPDGAIMIDGDFNIIWSNKVFQETFIDDEDGKKCYQEYRDRYELCKKCAVEKEDKVGGVHTVEVAGLCGERALEVRHTRITHNGEKVLYELFRDVTDRKESEKVNVELMSELEAKIEDLERFTNATLDREKTMIEMKEKLKKFEGAEKE